MLRDFASRHLGSLALLAIGWVFAATLVAVLDPRWHTVCLIVGGIGGLSAAVALGALCDHEDSSGQ